jgi:hypothetical protein
MLRRTQGTIAVRVRLSVGAYIRPSMCITFFNFRGVTENCGMASTSLVLTSDVPSRFPCMSMYM